MNKWRYHSLLLRDLSIADAKLNGEGDRGWELVNVCLVDANTARAYFKQPVVETVETDATAVVQVEGAFARPGTFA